MSLSFGYNDAAIIEVESEAVMLALDSDFPALEKIRPMAVVIACGHDRDMASHFFVPDVGIGEDPAIGSSQTASVPCWTKKLGRSEFAALHESARTGALHCRQEDNRAELGGRCPMLIVGQIQL